jgi:hypothetical protein
MAIIRRRKLFHLLAFIAVLLLAVQHVIAEESERSVTYDLDVEEISADVSDSNEVPVTDAVELNEDSTHESSIAAEPIDDEVETPAPSDVNLEALVDDVSATIDAPISDEEIEEDNVILEAAVSSLGESVSSKLISIANRLKGLAISDRFKGLAISKQNAKKIAAAGLGAWGAATGVGWAVQNFGGGKKLASK